MHLSSGTQWWRLTPVTEWGSKRYQALDQIHYSDVITGAMASQITSLTIVYSTVYSGADQRKHQSFASLAFVWGIHRWPVNFPHKFASNADNVSIWWRHHVLMGSSEIRCLPTEIQSHTWFVGDSQGCHFSGVSDHNFTKPSQFSQVSEMKKWSNFKQGFR